MHEWRKHFSCPHVKRLTITYPFVYFCRKSRVSLKTPSLVYLDYAGFVARKYSVALDSLVEARLDIRLYDPPRVPGTDEYYGDVTSLIQGMSNIQSLHLSSHSLEVFYHCCDSMPVLNKLLTLSIESDDEKGWQAMPRLLKSSPNLQTLVIKGLTHRFVYWGTCMLFVEEGVCSLSRCRVKVLEISGYGGSLRELKQLGNFLGKLECLETVRVGVDEEDNNKFLRDPLMALPRVSPKCKILILPL
ncbi:unnamed protein product [Microthlaspi erraticum]|nr:unnamed protein product [Microthlaspi erraticum]